MRPPVLGLALLPVATPASGFARGVAEEAEDKPLPWYLPLSAWFSGDAVKAAEVPGPLCQPVTDRVRVGGHGGNDGFC